MFQPLCEKVVLNVIQNGNIKAEQKEEYLYGLNMFFNVSVNILSMILIGLITGRLWECTVFCIVYKVIRKYTGGFHFESAVYCYISSCILYFMIIAAIMFIPFKIYEMSAIVILSGIILWILSPVEAINKPLDECEKYVFRKRARINIVLILGVYIISIFFNEELTTVVAISIITVMIFTILGKIKLLVYTKKRNLR